MLEMLNELQRIIDESHRIVAFTGAGCSTESGIPDFRSRAQKMGSYSTISTESGIPDFRSTDGLYNQKYAFSPETILSATFFRRCTEEFYRFYRDKMLPLEARPNAAHLFLAELERTGKLTAVITQNIDGLHQAAGSKNVLELHGSTHRNRCLKCAKFFPPEYIRDSQGIPRCECNGVIKPEVVLYEEGLDDAVMAAAVRHIRQADTMIIAGTSLTVYPAAGLVHDFKGKHLVLINRDVTPMDDAATLVIHDNVGKVFSTLTATPLNEEG